MKLVVAIAIALLLVGCKARRNPSGLEAKLVEEAKDVTIGGEDWTNPVPDTEAAVREGGEHFRHHCQICHGLDGQNTGVPFASKMDPPVANLASKDVQAYTDGQLKWIIQNGIRYTGMPAWRGVINDEEMWKIVRYLRHLPEKGSLGVPKVYSENASSHERGHKQ